MADLLMEEAQRMREAIRREVLGEVFTALTTCEIVMLPEGSGDRVGLRRRDVSRLMAKLNGGELVIPSADEQLATLKKLLEK